MKIAFVSAAVALALTAVGACSSVDAPAGAPTGKGASVEVPAGLSDKVGSGCPDLIKPEPVAVITKGFEVVEVARGAAADSCTVSVRGGREVLFVGLIGYPGKELAEQYVDMQCPGDGFEGADQSCKIAARDGKGLRVHGVAGRWEVKISVSEVPMSDEVEGAAVQILNDLRSSKKTA
ncbi:hypothetical protein [Nocardia sp. NRRL S-836]|uniref:hypothetical protein n=1 Tax=Nocardia sp. NRRL S-836 TaxID=1519492 RepID=UPI0006B06C60|nr:hypothetical protein [Nocardia sp. NRRL S-836]KOV82306.1 hypothetical protein ADL03_25360 [Nocardia sp. NRRL S-836]